MTMTIKTAIASARAFETRKNTETRNLISKDSWFYFIGQTIEQARVDNNVSDGGRLSAKILSKAGLRDEKGNDLVSKELRSMAHWFYVNADSVLAWLAATDKKITSLQVLRREYRAAHDEGNSAGNTSKGKKTASKPEVESDAEEKPEAAKAPVTPESLARNVLAICKAKGIDIADVVAAINTLQNAESKKAAPAKAANKKAA